MEPYYGFRIAGKQYVDDQISTHEHNVISDEEIENVINQ